MSGTAAGGRKARDTNLADNPNYYREIGGRGGRATYDGKKGFASNRELASRAGRIGGLKSRRGKSRAQTAEPETVAEVIYTPDVVAVNEEVRYIKASLWDSVRKRIKT